MPSAKINQEFIQKRRLPQGFYWDQTLKGFGVRVGPGRLPVSYVYQRSGRDRVALGRVGDISLDDARRAYYARAATAPIDTPNATLRQGMEAHCANMRARGCRERSIEAVRGEITRLSGDLLDKRLDKIARHQITAQHARATEASGKRTANRWHRHLMTIFGAAGVAPPPGRTPLNKENRGTPPLSEEELAAFAAALRGIGNPIVADWWRFVLITGLRRADALCVRWVDVGAKREGWLHRPDPKRAHAQLKPFDIPVTTQMATILARLPRVEGNPHLFVGNRRGRHLKNPELAGTPAAHRLRATWASRAVDLECPLEVRKALLNHTLKDDVTGGYTTPSPATLERWAQRVADSLWTAISQ